MKIIFGGDISTKNNKDSVDTAFCKALYREIAPVWEQADIRILNLENPLAEEGCGDPIIKSGPNIMGLPKNIVLLTEAGAHCAVLANNHFGDYGEEAMLSTLRLLDDNGIAHIGGGRNREEAYDAYYVEKDGVSVSVLAVCENEFGCADERKAGAAGYDVRLVYNRIQEEKQKANYVIVVFHGGHEHNPIPAPDTIDRYRMLIDFGADALIAMHTHCMQGYETYKEKPIVYSLGNLYFHYDNRDETTPWNHGYLAELTVEPDKDISFTPIPYVLRDRGRLLHLPTGEHKARLLDYLDRLSTVIRDPQAVQRYFDAWCVKSGSHYAATSLVYSKEIYEQAAPTEEAHRQIARTRNVLWCEAHHSLMKHLLKLEMEGRFKEAAAHISELEELINIPQA